jgi:hypothetical protein
VLPGGVVLHGYVVLPGVVVLVEVRQVVEVGEHKLHTGAPLLQPQLKDLECNALVLHTNILIIRVTDPYSFDMDPDSAF